MSSTKHFGGYNRTFNYSSMEIRFLGTGAPEGNPSPFCTCINCSYARKRRGKNIRLQASLLVNDDLIIDFGPDVSRACNALGISMSTISYALVTHCHFDHLYGGNIYHRLMGPRTTSIKPLHIYGPSRIHDVLRDWQVNNKKQKVVLHTIMPYQRARIGSYDVWSFAITQNDVFAGRGMCYAIRQKEKTFLYAVDTYVLPEKNFHAMRGLVFDAVILDETFGFKEPPNKDHHNIPLFLKTMQRFKKEGLAYDRTRFFAQHLSHHNLPHDRLSRTLAKQEITVAHDGMRIIC